MGEEGLKHAKEALEHAVASKVLPTEAVLEKMPLADPAKIHFFAIESYNHTTKKQPKGFDLKGMPQLPPGMARVEVTFQLDADALLTDLQTIAAGAVVPPGLVVPDGMVVMGVPGKIVREVFYHG